MYLTLIYRDEFVRQDFPKKQFYSVSKDLTTSDIENLIKYWRLNPFIESVYLNVKDNKYEKTNNDAGGN